MTFGVYSRTEHYVSKSRNCLTCSRRTVFRHSDFFDLDNVISNDVFYSAFNLDSSFPAMEESE